MAQLLFWRLYPFGFVVTPLSSLVYKNGFYSHDLFCSVLFSPNTFFFFLVPPTKQVADGRSPHMRLWTQAAFSLIFFGFCPFFPPYTRFPYLCGPTKKLVRPHQCPLPHCGPPPISRWDMIISALKTPPFWTGSSSAFFLFSFPNFLIWSCQRRPPSSKATPQACPPPLQTPSDLFSPYLFFIFGWPTISPLFLFFPFSVPPFAPKSD